MSRVDDVLRSLMGLTHLDMPDLPWWDMVGDSAPDGLTSEDVALVVGDAIASWYEMGGISEEEYESLSECL